MIAFTRTITESECNATYLNLTDDTGINYGKEFPDDRTRLTIIDDVGTLFHASKRGGNQIWGSISKWYKDRNIKPGTTIDISYNPSEKIENEPVIHIKIQKQYVNRRENEINIKEKFRIYLSEIHKTASTPKQYVNWLDKVQTWLIDNGVCSPDYYIWGMPELNEEINRKLNGQYLIQWQKLNNENKGWYSAPWNKWIDFNIKERTKTKEPITNFSIAIARPPFSFDSFVKKNIECGLQYNINTITRYISSLLTKPFVILTGLSGSGKTKIAQAFAMWICESEEQYRIVPVGADWSNREPLLGFPNALISDDYVKPENRALELIIAANKNPGKPYFLILDEMNLSHVERYFADFLSVMESKGSLSLHTGDSEWNGVPAKIAFPNNLFIVGTVNIDETTYMFSPKVLDRANVLEFRITKTEMEAFFKNTSLVDLDGLKGDGATMGPSFVALANNHTLATRDATGINIVLLNFFTELKKTGAEFGYRSATEIIRLSAVINHIAPDWDKDKIIDVAIMQKLLPKVHGSRRKLEPVLRAMGKLCLKDEANFDTYISSKEELDLSSDKKVMYPISFEKILRMYESLINNSFTSYAEA